MFVTTVYFTNIFCWWLTALPPQKSYGMVRLQTPFTTFTNMVRLDEQIIPVVCKVRKYIFREIMKQNSFLYISFTHILCSLLCILVLNKLLKLDPSVRICVRQHQNCYFSCGNLLKSLKSYQGCLAGGLFKCKFFVQHKENSLEIQQW